MTYCLACHRTEAIAAGSARRQDWQQHRKKCYVTTPAHALVKKFNAQKGPAYKNISASGSDHRDGDFVKVSIRDGSLDADTLTSGPSDANGPDAFSAAMREHIEALPDIMQPPKRWHLPNVYGTKRCAPFCQVLCSHAYVQACQHWHAQLGKVHAFDKHCMA